MIAQATGGLTSASEGGGASGSSPGNPRVAVLAGAPTPAPKSRRKAPKGGALEEAIGSSDKFKVDKQMVLSALPTASRPSAPPASSVDAAAQLDVAFA